MSVVKTIETITEVTKKLGLAKQAEQAIDNANTTQKVINSGLTASSALGAAAITAGAATTEVAANTAVAGSGAAASVAAVPIVGPILAVAAVGSVLAMLASSLPKFANGGIVQGGSISGDKILARVNAGEMILNQGQQSNLFALLNGKAGINSTSSGIGGTVEFKIDGKNLKGVLTNYDNIKSKVK